MPRPDGHARVHELALAYLDAEYRWELDGRWHALAVGAPPGDAFTRAHPDARSLGLLSAWNPQSAERPEALNREADAAMQATLEAAGLAHRPAFAAARNRSWREPGWLVVDMPPPTLDALARRFDQLGTLHWQRGGPVRLRMYAAPPGDAAGLPDCIDWLGSGPPPQA
jgi:hypothetical protein